MHTALSLLEYQRQFMDALYDDAKPGPLEAIAGHGLEPAARLRIYRNSCEAILTDALRTAYPAVLALVGEAFFAQTAHACLHAHPSRSGNLQQLGETFADYLASLPTIETVPYLPDVARLEWLRQQSALAADAVTLPSDAFTEARAEADGRLCVTLHPSVRLFDSPYPVLTIWRYTMQPSPERLTLGDGGESVVLWREEDKVAMAAVDAASFAFVAALAYGDALNVAHVTARSSDPHFQFESCVESLLQRGLIIKTTVSL